MSSTFPKGNFKSLSGERIVELAREGKVLLVFDGIDEKTVNLTSGQAYHLWSQLRRVAESRNPIILDGKKNADNDPELEVVKAKALFTCRTHYFKDMEDTDTQITGHREAGLRLSDFAIVTVTPFDRPMVEEYVKKVFGDATAVDVLKLIDEIYNLDELVSRPYLLALLMEHVKELEELRGRELRTAAGVYDLVIRSWVKRDFGKHESLPEEKKLLLMETLAAEMWEKEVQSLRVTELDDWIGSRIGEILPGVTFGPQDMPRLQAEVRTVSFIGWQDEKGNFKFLHRSMQEYFLARLMVRGLSRGKTASLDLPKLSNETLDFIVDIFSSAPDDDRRTAAECILQLLQSDYRARRSENALLLMGSWNRYGLKPTLKPRSLMLAGADLAGVRISGLKLDKLVLSDADLRKGALENLTVKSLHLGKADFTNGIMSDVVVEHADMTGASLAGGRFVGAHLPEVVLTGARCSCAQFKDSVIDDAVLQGTDLHRVAFVRTSVSGVDFKGSGISWTGFVDWPCPDWKDKHPDWPS